jgi:hypothetical protein
LKVKPIVAIDRFEACVETAVGSIQKKCNAVQQMKIHNHMISSQMVCFHYIELCKEDLGLIAYCFGSHKPTYTCRLRKQA